MRHLSKYNFWYDKDASSKIKVECFLPNGMFVSFPDLRADTQLEKIKEKLWTVAQASTLSRLLKEKQDYAFSVVSSNGGTEELLDEQLTLFDVKPFKPYLKVVRKPGNAKLLDSKISIMIGRTITPQNRYPEVDDMRSKFIPLCEQVAHQRGTKSWEHRAIYTYPPEFGDTQELPEKLIKKLENMKNTVFVSVSIMSANSSVKNIVKTLEITKDTTPSDLIDLALLKRSQTLNQPNVENSQSYVLKVCGRYSFFLGVFEIIDGVEHYIEKNMFQYKYIRDCISYDKKPRLIVVPKHELDIEQPQTSLIVNEPAPKLPERPKIEKISLWELKSSYKLRIKILYAININAGHMWKEVRCGIYHGAELVCDSESTSAQMGDNLRWDELLEFKMNVAELPRMARYCFSIIGYHKQDKSRKKPALIAWVNVPVFNYKGVLRQGQDKLCCWQHNTSMDSDTKCFDHPFRTVSQNNENENGVAIGVDFMKFEHPVEYPTDEEVHAKAVEVISGKDGGSNPYQTSGGKLLGLVQEIVRKDTLADLLEEEKELLWLLRADCFGKYPESLPKLLQCVKWNSVDHVCQIRVLLQSWRIHDLEVEIALDLLDYKFPDIVVRELAVRILEQLADGDLELYLLHLVQALKYESYMNSKLAEYLLTRALNNRRIGHFLFWHLKAEVNNPEYSVQFGLLLELYCRGAGEHVDILLKQVEAINKMKTVSEVLQSNKDFDEGKKMSLMKECFHGSAYTKAFSNIVSPLDPSIKLKTLKVNQCKFMNSKKKPLWLVFENSDDEGEDVMIIFKNGDDLRQDTLTLLCMRLMDTVWKKEGLDYGLNIYRCLPTGPMVGLIEVVRGHTLGRIQASKGSIMGVWQSQSLYSHLQDQADNEDKLKVYLENFTQSVVGYSIATYVLGIGDRHNDNIMIKDDSGELFHIDFGHFLGNFKTKFGLKREFVKFVLTDDMLFVVNKFREDGEELLKEKCKEAFRILRSKGNLFMSVFAMLLSTGIPELEIPHDLDYLRNSLAMTKSDPDAVLHFEKSYREALENRKKTTANWMIHNIRHRWVAESSSEQSKK